MLLGHDLSEKMRTGYNFIRALALYNSNTE